MFAMKRRLFNVLAAVSLVLSVAVGTMWRSATDLRFESHWCCMGTFGPNRGVETGREWGMVDYFRGWQTRRRASILVLRMEHSVLEAAAR
jgi:hypothetical protein